MHLLALSILAAILRSAHAAVIIDYNGGSPALEMGKVQLEGVFKHDWIEKGNDSIFIKPGTDPCRGTPALHYHRDAPYRRAEVKGKGVYAANKRYDIRYDVSFARSHNGLSIFQWKKADGQAAPLQNIPFNIQFDNRGALSLGYTPPEGKYHSIWAGSSPLELNQTHSIRLSFDTKSSATTTLIMWIDDTQVLSKDGLVLWTGNTYPKFGLYRGEQSKTGPDGPDWEHVFDAYVHKVRIDDADL
ncbi:hypothetical protein FGG08_007178 [Glutinoglossum americanum]|uniref:Uncharacterized protein n=1 Tax=Glutinoglossum americanum TaxID=1670608 RepID=A0A9P8HUT2_9PEZI|nr:hypothetical protein FGG08_007178 [Glutinoglossum americanum]